MVSRSYSGRPANESDLLESLHRTRGYLRANAKYFGLGELYEDTVQDTYIKVSHRLRTGNPVYLDGLDNFVRQTHRNVCADERRRVKNRVFENSAELFDEDVSEFDPNHQELVDRDFEEFIQRELDQMPRQYKDLLYILLDGDTTGSQMSQELGISDSNRKIRKARAIKMFAGRLAPLLKI